MKRNYFVYNDDLKKETIRKSLLLGSTRVKTTAEKKDSEDLDADADFSAHIKD